MNPTPRRNSNLILCYTLIALGILCVLGTIFAAAYLKNGIIERVREPQPLYGIGDSIQLQSIERQIKAKEQSIEFEKQMPDMDDFEQKMQEAKTKSNKNSGANKNLPNIGSSKAEKLKKLEEEKQKLITERDDLIGKMRAKEMKPRTWGEWAEDYNLELFLGGVLPLGLFSLYLMRFMFSRKLPNNNPLSLTDFERRCVLFLPFAIVFSAFGFFLFVWFLSIFY